MMQQPKPILLTHDFNSGSLTESEPVILRWNGVDLPKVLRTIPPGQYVLLPFEPSDDALRPEKEAA